MSTLTETATFAAGCFWGVQAAFGRVKGVLSTEVGYTGGHTENPGYEEVCTDTTGHAESVRLTFDPSVVSYRDLLEVFWQIHDPTTLNRQGPDVGSQYRSVIFYHSEAQKQQAEASLQEQQQSRFFRYRTIVTAIEPASTFYRAEEYHQHYLAKL